MAPKILWVALPLLLYAVWLAAMRWRGRTPGRLALNVHTSVLLLCYLLSTAGLGIFWVANQQLPVFDWHYLFGYATLLLVFIHLCFNLPLVLNWLRNRAPAARPASAGTVPRGAPALGMPLAVLAALAAAFFLGMRHGAGDLPLQAGAGTASDAGGAGNAGGAGGIGGAAAVLRYHELSSESRRSVFLRAPGIEWGDAPEPFKRYPNARQVALPAASPASQPLQAAMRGPAATPQRRLRLDELAQILHLAAGVTAHRGGRALRAAPSSGALFPSELYVAARTIDGLAPGLYHYGPEQHRLAWIGPLPAAADGLGAPAAQDADALLVLSAVFRRTGYKYHNRAYRYAAADAGHLLENLRIAGHQAGMHATLLPQFDEAMAARALAIDGVEEGVLAMMALRRSGPVPVPGTERAPAAQEYSAAAAPAAPAAPRSAPSPPPAPQAAQATLGATGVIHQATSLRLLPRAGEDTEAAAPPYGRLAADALPQGALRLPAPVAAPASAHAVIAQRRSVRRYTSGPVPLAALATVLEGMAQNPQLSDAIRIDLVVNRVAGLEPGVYRYLPQHALLPVTKGDFAARAQQAALAQDVIGGAAVVLVLSADTAGTLAQGARGYRHAFLEAGMVGERWLLGAVAQGLAACPVGAFYDDEAAALVQARGRWVLHFAALGQPAK